MDFQILQCALYLVCSYMHTPSQLMEGSNEISHALRNQRKQDIMISYNALLRYCTNNVGILL